MNNEKIRELLIQVHNSLDSVQVRGIDSISHMYGAINVLKQVISSLSEDQQIVIDNTRNNKQEK